ncbi:MAG: alpha/beta fold hydrolase [Blastocatellia bacterium]
MGSVHRETGFLDRSLRRSDGLHRYVVYVPRGWTGRKKWPVILFLHGAGERGADGLQQTEVGLGPAIRKHADRFPCIAAFPQCPLGSWWAFPDAEALALDVLERTVADFRGDPARLYLTGVSMGGYGVWDIATNFPGVFAALAPVCGGIVQPKAFAAGESNPTFQHVVPGRLLQRSTIQEPPGAEESDSRLSSLRSKDGTPSDPYERAAMRIGKTPAWLFHGELDPVVPVEESRKMVQALGQSGAEVRYTEYEGAGHQSWEPAYSERELVPWLLSHKLPTRQKQRQRP